MANILWATGYDTGYAMVDRDDDLRAGAKSTAILFGSADLLAQAVIFCGFLLTMALLGQRLHLGMLYFASLIAAAGLIAWQFRIARRRQRDACFRAFLHNAWVGLVVFAGIALALAIRRSEEHTSELQSLMRISYAVFCL